MPGGRPTKYNEDMLGKANAYIDKFGAYNNDKFDELPMLEGMSETLDVCIDTLHEWGRVYPEFSYVLKRLKKVQAKKLIDKSLNGKYNPIIAKMLLNSKHGYVEQRSEDITSKGEKISFNNGVPRPKE
jgi:hypothetical protein